MNDIAFVFGNVYIHWSGIILALAAACTMLMTISLRVFQEREVLSAVLLAPLALVLGLFFGRLVHWYCRYEQYEGLFAALVKLSGGFSLVGVFFGCLLAALILRLLRVTDNLPALLDCLAPAGMLGIGVGRLSALFTSVSRGKILIGEGFFRRLPFAAELVNTAGQTEWRFAVFCVQSIVAFAGFAFLTRVFYRTRGRAMKRENWKDGNVFLLFLMFWGATEVVLDSMRYDALFLRSNGFVSMVQVVGAVSLLFVLVMYSIRSVRANRLRIWHFVLWGLFLALLGGVGYMEYYVQRHGDEYLLCYSVMSMCMAGIVAVIMSMYRTTARGREMRRGVVSAAEDPIENDSVPENTAGKSTADEKTVG
ncbi:MAG: prolipoprotein diacylglyceryl transferase [Eubacteriales bacterium]|nr:prolipoprotein diacylglyceryl transferase [Eubacteriales bacterium]